MNLLLKDDTLITQQLFNLFKLPVARNKGSFPLFVDFSISNSENEITHPYSFERVLSQTTCSIDGIIVAPNEKSMALQVGKKEIWERVDKNAEFLPPFRSQNTALFEQISTENLASFGASAVVGTLLLGNSSTNEADNIQFLSLLRSRSLQVGIPLVIEISVLNDTLRYTEIVELGFNLAVELGCDIAIVPAGDYINTSLNISKIKKIPLLVRDPFKTLDQDLLIANTYIQSDVVDGMVINGNTERKSNKFNAQRQSAPGEVL
jgi:hypothetical protein